LKLLIFTSLHPGDWAMPPRPRTSSRALFLDPPWAWRSRQPTPSLASFKLNYALLSMARSSKSTRSRYYRFPSASPLISFSTAVWSDISSEALLLIPLEARISDVKWAEVQLARDQYRAARHYPPRWQDATTLRLAAKVLHLSDKSFGERGHNERLRHERHWTVGHNACKGAKSDFERKSLLTCQLCASDTSSADNTL